MRNTGNASPQTASVALPRDEEVTALPVRPDLLKALAYCWIGLAALFYVYDLVKLTRHGLTDGAERPLGWDFINTWSGAFLAWQGEARTVYDWYAFHAFQERLVGAPLDMFNYSYPPVLLVLTLPLAALPYVPALVAWTLAGWFAFYAALRAAMPSGALLLALATPAVFINAVGGQNGAWSAALLGGGLCLLGRRPVIAGVLFGLLIYKPHLGLLLPVALLAGRQWRALIAAAVTATAIILLSFGLFGVDIWADYLRHASIIRRMALDDGSGVWHRMLSVFVFGRRLGFDLTSAYALQLVTALAVVAAVAYAWLRNAPANARNALVVAGTCLVTPYLHDYDLPMTAFVAAWLMTHVQDTPQLQRPAFFASALFLLLPFVGSLLANITGYAFGPIFVIPAFVVAWRIAFVERNVPQTAVVAVR